MYRTYAAAKSLQLCLTLYDPIDGSPPSSAILGFSRQEYWSGVPLPSPIELIPMDYYRKVNGKGRATVLVGWRLS